ncbi:carbohydrate-binding protein [Sulfoacidibacillus thermotolerans]|uniref:Carbohydrate binding module family 25 domain-containing protein n=1 Tax=Sulfoacidibacillus thermotolerans TaxID=1765684 RepID=A0A2U3D791_SULT2|nr:carbohydrate-binding protein [Sulfoacidibacillus thermotolerans]PWI57141.1 hypothetical protein BM613_10325 [Sulfoacidibacillus thermotolerans]
MLETRWGRRFFLTFGILFALSTSILPGVSAATINTGTAPDGPGNGATWAPSNKTFLGRAENPASTADDVWFTGANGVITEMFYPWVDTPDYKDLQFIVGDAGNTWDQTERSNSTHSVTLVNNNALAWNVTNTGTNGDWQIKKTIYTDPNSPVVIQQVTFTALKGTLGDYLLYVYANPAQYGNGNNDTGQTVDYNGQDMLVTTGEDTGGNASNASALAVGNGLGWLTQNNTLMLSNGFVGVNDGLTNLLGGSTPSYTMTDAYDLAQNGNVANMGEFNLNPVANQTSVTFDVVVGFGATAAAAESNAANELTNLASNPGATENSYISQWNNYESSLNQYGGIGGEQYNMATMVLKAAQDPSTGAIVAGIGTPWGNTNGPGDEGYHLAWARDLYNSASAMILDGDLADADAALWFLFNDQQESDGHFPQNSFVNGIPFWTGVEMDQTAYPIILAWKLRNYDPSTVNATTYADHILPAAKYLVANGPYTPLERWEENAGYSPSTMAAEVAGLYLASKIAALNGDTTNAALFQHTADYWAALIPDWTYTTNGPFGNGQYFIRIAPGANPNNGASVTIANGGGTYNENAIVDNGYLQLAILGIKSAQSPYITSSLAVTANPNAGESAGSLEETFPNGSISFFRYNHDGYGSTSTGANFDGTGGIGGLWPILTAEYAQDQFLLGHSVSSYITDMQSFANGSYMIPEQVWQNNPPSGYTAGTPANSMNPLDWSMAQYISLVAAQANFNAGNSQLPGMPMTVYDHFVANAYQPHSGYTVDLNSNQLVQGDALTIFYNPANDGSPLQGSNPIYLHWGYNNWVNPMNQQMIQRPDGFWETTISVPTTATSLNFAFTNSGETTWDNNGGGNWNYTINSGSHTPVASPIDTWPNPLVGGQPATIYYDGSLSTSSATTSITLHWGYNNWNGVTNTPMTNLGNGYWAANIIVPSGSQLNAAFYNQAGTWDNNNGNNYNPWISQP